MRGVITAREVLQHGWTIVREFGPGAYGRCVVAVVTGRPTTFLAVVSRRRRPARRPPGALVALALGIAAAMTLRPEARPPARDDWCIRMCDPARDSA